MAFDQDALRAFVDGGDKSPPPVFVGRADILEDIERKASLAWKGAGAAAHGIPGVTRIVQGAPGAGKSSILAELRSRSLVRRGGERAGGEPRVLFLTSEMLEESVPRILDLLREAGRLAQHEWLERGRHLLGRASRHVESVSAAGAGIGLTRPEIGGLLALREALPPQRWARPVIVAIDEAQKLRRDRHAPPALFLQGVHNGETGLPLTLVLAGLGDTAGRVADMDLTRGTVIHEIGSLGAGEVSSFMSGSCRKFGIDPGDHGKRLDALARPCDGWPRHLHFALQALGREALAVGGDLAGVDWRKVGQEAAESRVRYYLSQKSPEMSQSKHLVASVMRQVPGPDEPGRGFDAVDLLEAIEGGIADRPGHRLPEGMSVNGLFRHLLHRGALHERANKTVHCPIPSFRAHLVEAGGPEPGGRDDALAGRGGRAGTQ